jgi:hypothetical protein
MIVSFSSNGTIQVGNTTRDVPRELYRRLYKIFYGLWRDGLADAYVHQVGIMFVVYGGKDDDRSSD